MEKEIIKGYKGFNGELKCRGYQYEVGKEYTQEGDIKCCNNGFHFCENPFDTFNYYPPSTSRYCVVEGTGVTDRTDDKTAVSHIKIKDEIGLDGLINAGVNFILDKVNWKDNSATNTGDYSAATNTGYKSAATNTGDYSAATNTGNKSAATNTGDKSAATNTGYSSAATNTGNKSAATNTGDYSAATNTGNKSAATNTGNYSAATNTGDYSAATNTGDYSAATNAGDYSAATVEGKESIAIVTGYKSKAAGALGCWIVLTERDDNGNILDVKATKVDGEIIKPNTFYSLIDGKIMEINDNNI